MCNACVKSCPWSNPSTWSHNLVRELIMNIPLMHPIAIQGARLIGTSVPILEEKWWFDMEYVDDVIQSRETTGGNIGNEETR